MKRAGVAVAAFWIGAMGVPRFALAGWSQAVRVSMRSPYGGVTGPATVGVDRSGDQLAVWAQQNGFGPTRVMAASRLTRSAAWSAPTRLSPPDVSADYPVAAVSASGRAVAAWVANPLPHTNDRHPPFIQASIRFPDGRWSAPTLVSPGGAAGRRQIGDTPAVAMDGPGDAVAAWIADPTRGRLERVEVATFDAAERRWSSPAVLATSTDASGAVQVAGNARGDVIVVWRKARANSRYSEIEAAVRAHGSRSWQRFLRLGRADELPEQQFLSFEPLGPQVAIDSRGNALVVWQGGRGGQIRTRASAWLASDHRWHRQRAISRAFAVWPHVTSGPSGHFAVIWVTRSRQIAEASKGVSQCCWTKPSMLSRGPGLSSYLAYPKIALGPNGEAVAAWSGRASIDVVDRANGTQPWTSPRTLGGEDAGLAGIAMNSRGNAAIVWVQPGKAHNQRPDNYIDAATYHPPQGP